MESDEGSVFARQLPDESIESQQAYSVKSEPQRTQSFTEKGSQGTETLRYSGDEKDSP